MAFSGQVSHDRYFHMMEPIKIYKVTFYLLAYMSITLSLALSEQVQKMTSY